MANLKDLIVSGSARILGNLYATLKGNADTATKLETPRTIRINLASTLAPDFDGTTSITPGVTGTLPVANGGTGQTSIANIQAGKDADGNVISTTYATKTELDDNLNTIDGKISNCILEIPQNIKLTLENNVLTLKAGSILTRTGKTYSTFTLTQDNVWNLNVAVMGDDKLFMFTGGNGHTPNPKSVSRTFSGDSSSYPNNPRDGDLYFNTTDKTIYAWRNNQSAWETYVNAYPFCVIEIKNHQLSFAKDSNGNDMIFNGAGFIGHYAFVYPGVEWLAANNINTDGTLKSAIVKNSALQIIQLSNFHNTIFGYTSTVVAARTNIGEYASYNELPTSNLPVNPIAYLKDENVMCYFSSDGWTRYPGRYVKIVDFNYDGTTVIDFTIRQPIRLVTTEMLDDIQKKTTEYKGTFVLGTQYYEGNIVKYSSNFYEALQNNINVLPNNTANWSKISNDNVVKFTEKSDNVEYPIGLTSSNASGSNHGGFVNFTAQNKPTINASTGVITATGGIVGKTETTGDNSTKYASTAFVQTAISGKADDSNVVHKTGNETIAGNKTFSSVMSVNNVLYVQKDNPLIYAKINDFDVTTNPESSHNVRIAAVDKNETWVAGIYYNVNTSGSKTMDLRVKQKDGHNLQLGLGEKADGTGYSYCIAPTENTTTSTQIDTVGARNTAINAAISSSSSMKRSIGEIIQSTIPLSDAGLHLLDGSLISGSGTYSAFVTYMSSLVSEHSDLFTTEADWQATYTEYGVCGKFVYNSTDNTIRLPYITGFIEGTLTESSLGNVTEAGLPNITGILGTSGYVGEQWSNDNVITGAFYKDTSLNDKKIKDHTGTGTGNYNFGFDASLSNNIYNNSTTVQPQSIKVFYYILLANAIKTDIEVDIDNIQTELNDTVRVSDLTEAAAVVETYKSGADWYRVWSDGWIEQGGIINNESGIDKPVSLLKAMIDTTYTVALSYGDYTVNSQYTIAYKDKTTKGFTIGSWWSTNSNLAGPCNWYVCGY